MSQERPVYYFALLSLWLLDELELPPLVECPTVSATALPLGPVADVLLLEVEDVELLWYGKVWPQPSKLPRLPWQMLIALWKLWMLAANPQSEELK